MIYYFFFLFFVFSELVHFLPNVLKYIILIKNTRNIKQVDKVKIERLVKDTGIHYLGEIDPGDNDVKENFTKFLTHIIQAEINQKENENKKKKKTFFSLFQKKTKKVTDISTKIVSSHLFETAFIKLKSRGDKFYGEKSPVFANSIPIDFPKDIVG